MRIVAERAGIGIPGAHIRGVARAAAARCDDAAWPLVRRSSPWRLQIRPRRARRYGLLTHTEDRRHVFRKTSSHGPWSQGLYLNHRYRCSIKCSWPWTRESKIFISENTFLDCLQYEGGCTLLRLKPKVCTCKSRDRQSALVLSCLCFVCIDFMYHLFSINFQLLENIPVNTWSAPSSI